MFAVEISYLGRYDLYVQSLSDDSVSGLNQKLQEFRESFDRESFCDLRIERFYESDQVDTSVKTFYRDDFSWTRYFPVKNSLFGIQQKETFKRCRHI